MRYVLNISKIRRARELTQTQLADMIGVEQPTVQRWENGERNPTIENILKVSAALGVTPGELFGNSFVPLGPRLYVKGDVAAGMWREAYEVPETEWITFTGRADVTAPMEYRFGLRVIGDSMNEVYPHGTIVECVSLMANVALEAGKRVIVVRRRHDGLLEATVKEYVIDEEGRPWAVPRSSNPLFQQALRLDEHDGGIEEVSVVAVVVGSYRPE